MNTGIKNAVSGAVVVAVAIGTGWAVHHYRRPGQLDVISAQAMDMTQMRPPTGAAPVALAPVQRGAVADAVTYTGTVAAFNEQDIAPRITGTLLAVPVYPGDRVRAGQLLARLDAAEVDAKAQQAAQEAREARLGAQVALDTHHLHHRAALDQASAQLSAAEQGVTDMRAEAGAAADAVPEAQAALQSAQASADYWRTEIAREKQLAGAGAASQQEYQNELAQSQAAVAVVGEAQARVRQARASAVAARGKVTEAQRQAEAAQATQRMAEADLAVAAGQAEQAGAGADAAQAAARQAAVVRNYTRIIAPVDGVVVARPVAPGTLVQPGTAILKLAEIDRVRVQAHVAVEDLAGIRPGTPVQIALHGVGGPPRAARVTSVFPAANDETRTAVVEAVLPNADHRLLPGAFVTMRIAKNTGADGLLIPASAVTTAGGASYVWTTGGAGATGAASVYECVICHIHYTAAQALKFHYRDPMEGGRLVPVKGTAPAAPATGLTAHRVAVRVGTSDGTQTEVASPDLAPGDRVVAHGQAGLSEGVRVVATPWTASGPQALPMEDVAGQGQTLYRCEKCGMTYSEADARRNNFIDPMDGGRLVRVGGR